MFQGVKEFVSSYKESFDRIREATKQAKKRMKDRDESYTTKAGKEKLEKEIKEVIDEWDKKIEWGTNAHRVIQQKGIEKYPNAILGEYTKRTYDIPKERYLDINKVEKNTRYYEKYICDPLNELVCYIDELFIDKNWNIHLTEYKSCSVFDRSATYGVKTPQGFKVKTYYPPIDNIVDNNFYQAALQSSTCMYLLWYYNKKLKPKSITLKHIILNEDTGAIESTKDYDGPYLLEEVKQLLKHKKK